LIELVEQSAALEPVPKFATVGFSAVEIGSEGVYAAPLLA
jgi:hypothetical protein